MYHHYKSNDLPRSDEIQKMIVNRILACSIPDTQRENSKVWELKHCSSCIQVGRILAIKRGLNIELAEVICALHDIYAIDTGHYQNHAEKGATIAEHILSSTGKFSVEEIAIITEAIRHHSDKHIYSDDPYVELIKDADIFDCSLYEGTRDYYEIHKPPAVRREYYRRIQNIRRELGLPQDEKFNVAPV